MSESSRELRPRMIDRFLGATGGTLSTRARVLWCAVWLVFLAYPVDDIFTGHYPFGKAALAWVSLVAFVALYIRTLWLAFASDPDSQHVADLRPYIALMILTPALVVAFGGQWGGLVIYLGVATGLTLPLPASLVVLSALAAFEVAAGALMGRSVAEIAFVAFLSFALGVSMVLLRRIGLLVVELRAAREDLARLAVAEERLRFSRDLHDGLGHSLSVIALKSQVARRLMDRDPPSAQSALADVENVAHESLVSLRHIVGGYRLRSLDDELRNAAEVLAGAGIMLDLAPDRPQLSTRNDGLLAWAVREGVTNVIRHSHARHCHIAVGADGERVWLELSDDGVGGCAGHGSGLRGLGERMGSAGGTLTAGPREDGGFGLRVQLPLSAA